MTPVGEGERVVVRVPAAAMAALRGHVERFLRAHGAIEGECLAEASLDRLDLAEMLVAGLRYVRHEHPWIGRKGTVIEPPEPDEWKVPFTLCALLPFVEPLTIDACLDALVRVKGLQVVDEPCGRREAVPCAHPYRGYERSESLDGVDLSEAVFGIVAEAGWVDAAARRNAAFEAALPTNGEPHGFVELDADAGASLAAFLLAGYERRAEHRAHRAAAEAFVRFFGASTRVFALEDPQGTAWEDPFEHGLAWSQYTDGYGCWGKTLAVVVTDGERLAYLDCVWDVSCE